LGSSGNVGIGVSVTNPTYQLEVGNSTGGTIAVSTAGSAGSEASPLFSTINFLGYINNINGAITVEDKRVNLFGGWMNFHVRDSSDTLQKRMTIDNYGKVGIGTASPGATLHVKTATNSNFLVGTSNTELLLAASNDALNAYTPMQFYASEFNLMSGYVGVGTLAPQGRLHILTSGSITTDTDNNNEVIITGPDHSTSSSLGNLAIISNSTATDGFGGSLVFGGTYSGTSVSAFAKLAGVREGGSFTGALAFYTRAGAGTLPERMRITSTGNVGIGTTSPSTTLHVAGVTTLGGNLLPSADATYDIASAAVQFRDAYLSRSVIISQAAIPAGGVAGRGLGFSSTANFGVFFGSGTPTLSAAKGSLYLRSDGSGTGDRMYVNTDGATAWTAVTTAT